MKKSNPNQIPKAHLEEDKESPGELTGEQVPDPSGHEDQGGRVRRVGQAAARNSARTRSASAPLPRRRVMIPSKPRTAC
jgi:hypothetical protein